MGIYARHVAHVGLSGRSDADVWRHAFDHDFAVATMNAGDFLTLAAGVDLHPGLIVLREGGLTRAEQWSRIERAVRHLADNGIDPVNRVIEVFGPTRVSVRDMPPP